MEDEWLFLSSFPVEILQSLVCGSLGGPLGPAISSHAEQDGTVGPVSLPRRAETFGGFDSHQMSVCKGEYMCSGSQLSAPAFSAGFWGRSAL